MNLETLYVKYNFPASSTFLKLLKNEGFKYTKKMLMISFLIGQNNNKQL